MTFEVFSEDKARLFKTAIFTKEAHGLISGRVGALSSTDPVRVVFMSVQFNAYHKRYEPVFACYRTMQKGDLIGTYFQSALHEFCL